MTTKHFSKKTKNILIAFTSLILLSAIPYFAGPGIENAAPVGAYLNGVFPSQTPTTTSTSNASYNVENAFPNLTFIDPVDMVELPNSTEFLVLGLQGHIWKIDNDESTTNKDLLLDISDNVVVNTDGGMLGITLHPEYGQTGSENSEYIYVFYRYSPVNGTDGNGSQTNGYMRLSRFNLPLDSNTINPASEQILINIYDRNDWHNGGDMFFGPEDGFLYLALGDEGGANDNYGVTQQIDKWLFGGVLRIDIDQRGGSISHPIRKQPLNRGTPPSGWSDSYTQNYYIPNDNPWLDTNGGILEEFYAIGTRSPHRMTIDPPTGDIWIGDIGQGAKEEISVVRKGDNLQWPYKEGDQNGPKAQPSNLTGNDRPPIHAYGRSVGTCVIGGFVYRGSKFPELNGKYLFGDQTTQNVWTLNKTGENSGDVNYLLNVPVSGVGSKDGISSFFSSSDEDIYILDLFGTGRDGAVIRKVVRSGPSIDPPQKLSDLNVFTDLQALTPIDGLVPYDLNAPLWSDGAKKRRWIALTNDGIHNSALEQIDFEKEDNWSFPPGTVAIKQFDLPTDENDPTKITKLETRFLVFTEDNTAYAVSYKWNDEQTDAFLIGIDEDISQDYDVTKNDGSIVSQTWNFPNRSQCIQCHNSVAGYSLGLKTRQLNKSYTYPSSGITSNQLETWNHLNMFSEELEGYTDLPASANINSETASNEMKVRSYIDANCAFCHRPNGVEGAFDGRSLTPLYDQSLINTLAVSHGSLPGYELIVPQDIQNSLLYLRDNSTGTDRMPPIGRNLVDEDYMEVLTGWIEGLDIDGPKTIEEGQYTIQVRHSSKFMAVSNASLEGDALVVEISSNLEDHSNWYLEPVGNKKYRIKAKHSDLVLSLRDLRSDRGANVIQESWNGNQHQLWYIEDVDEEYVYIINVYNGLVLNVSLTSTEEQSPLNLWTKENSAQNQQWKIGPPATRVTGITVNPIVTTISEGETATLNITVSPEDATDISVTWSSSDDSIATVNTNGLVTGVGAGSVTITVTTTDGSFTAESTITVNIPVSAITVTPSDISVSVGDSATLTTEISPSNATDNSVTWSSSDNGIATVNVNGVVTAISAGTANISVTTTDGNFTDESIITVLVPVSGISLDPETISLAEGATSTLNATVSPSNASDTSLSWQSSDDTIATVSSNGLVNAIAAGTATITVTTLDGSFTDESVITVFQPTVDVSGVSVNPQTLSLAEGAISTLNATVSPSDATDNSLTWSSSDDTIATVSTNGTINAITAGEATITVATLDGNFTDESVITVFQPTVDVTGVSVTPQTLSLAEGSNSTLTAIVSPSNASDNSVSWKSSDENIATVSTNGIVNAIAAGTATITVTALDGSYTDESIVTVFQPTVDVTGVSVNPQTLSLAEGSNSTLTATVSPSNASDNSVSWSSSDDTIATVNTNGIINTIAAGEATITVTTLDGNFTDESVITVSTINEDCSATGVIAMRRYDQIPGIQLNDLFTAANFPDSPSVTIELEEFEIPPYVSNNYGAWVSGYICAPETGKYYFWISGDDHVRLNLSSNDNSANTSTIAYHNGHTNLRLWTRYDSQKSIAIDLVEGESYYIEAFMKEGVGGDHLSIGWRKPSNGDGEEPFEIIPGSVLSPNENIPYEIAVTGVSINPAQVSIYEGNTTELNVQVSPSNAANSNVSWSSSDTNIATVDNNGVVTAIAKGNAFIIAETNDGGYTAQSRITVLSENQEVCNANGSITMRRYDNIGGITLNEFFVSSNFPDNPTNTSELNSFEIPSNVDNNYGAWVSGYLCAPETGTYYFWVSGDDYVQLNLSSNDDMSNMETIAFHNGHTNPKIWDKYTSQKSVGIELEQGKSYYIEGYMKEGVGGDHFAVGWRKPSDGDGTLPYEVIPGYVLSSNTAQLFPLQASLKDFIDVAVINVFPNPATDYVNIETFGAYQFISITVFDTKGSVVNVLNQDAFQSSGQNYQLNTSQLAKGVYTLLIVTDDFQQHTEKIIIR